MYRKQLQRYNHVPQALSLYRKMIHDIYEFAQMVCAFSLKEVQIFASMFINETVSCTFSSIFSSSSIFLLSCRSNPEELKNKDYG